ncbi:hypothetical protein ACG1BZ_09370 [Microbulbifer sp. CNSA002]|uniref:hypothetical protein n=1 Tax=Microbulbifer sp. CNSA002 TaxID=3373604 RepID=UPI0039B67839
MSKRTTNNVVASVWFVLAFIVFMFVPFSIYQKGTVLISPALIGIGVLLVFMGRQRTQKWQLQGEKFNTIIRYIGFTTSFLACLSIILGGIH